MHQEPNGLFRRFGRGARSGLPWLLLTLLVYLPGLQWGLPYATAADRTKTYATDEILPLEGLAEMHNTFVGAKADRNYGYPWWHYAVVAAAQAPYLGLLRATHGLSRPTPTYPFGLADPVQALRVLTLIGRLVSVLMAAGIVIAVYWIGRIAWDRRVGFIAAILVLLDYLMLYYGRTGNLDVPAMFWTALGLLVFVAIAATGLTARRAALLGVLAGLAMATKDQAVLVFFPVALALLVPLFAPIGESETRGRAIAVGLGCSIAAYLVATGMLFDPGRHLTHVRLLLFSPGRLAPGAVYFPRDPHLLRDFVAGLGRMLTWPVFVLFLVGTVLVARSRPRLLVLLAVGPLLFLAIALPTGTVVLRYLLPVAIVAELFAAVALVRLTERSPLAAGAVLVVVLVGRLATYADLVHSELTDTRYAAGRWLRSHAKAGDRLEYFGVNDVLPPLDATIVTRRIAGRERWVGDRADPDSLLRYLATNGPEWIVSIPDWTSTPEMDRSADCPESVCQALKKGTAGYEPVAFYPRCALFHGLLARPPLDNPSVCPPVTVFARHDVRARLAADELARPKAP